MWRDLRLAARTLRKSPGFAVAAILTLGLGIGANGAIFSIIDRLVIHQFPEVDQPDRVMWLFANHGKVNLDADVVTAADFGDWRTQSKTFEAFTPLYATDASLTGGGQPERLVAMVVSRDFFRVFGTQLHLGRIFSPEEETDHGPTVAILGDGFWKRRFAADPQIVGKKVVLNGQSTTVIGVMPPFMFPRQADVFFPTRLSAADWKDRKQGAFAALGRLREGVSREAAQAEMDVISQRLAAQYPDTNHDLRVHAVPLPEVFNMRAPLYALLAGVAFILLIACANVANLQIARGMARQREMAVRQAIGASRGRLVRQLLCETLLVALVGAIVGIGLAWVGVDVLRGSMPERYTERVPQLRELHVSFDVLVFSLGLALVTTIVSGLVPALRGSRVDLTASLKEGAQGASAGRRRQRLAGALVAGQMMLAMVLLAGAGVTLRSFVALAETPLGFRAEGLYTLRLPLDTAAYEKVEKRHELITRILERVGALPGVESVAASDRLPLTDPGHSGDPFQIVGDPPLPEEDWPTANLRGVTPDFLRTFQIPLLRGRSLLRTDRNVVLISDSVARRFFADREPIGRHLVMYKSDYEIVGVVGDVADTRPNVRSFGALYAPAYAPGRAVLTLRAADARGAGLAAVGAIHEVDPDVVIDHPATMLAVVAESRTTQRLVAWIIGLMGVIGLVLAALGIYGLVSYAVGQRTREIGIRMALGAQTKAIVRAMMMRALVLTVVGIGLGFALSVPISRALHWLFYLPGGGTWIPLGAVAVLLVAVAGLAAFVPARRASRIDPMLALRSE